MHYLEAGEGAPIVFLHGNPTSSYLWRKVILQLAPKGRCIAPDLIGMGASGKPDIAYRLSDHIAYLDAFLEALALQPITFVLHDWGVALGLDYLTRFPENVRAVAYMEGHMKPIPSWEQWDEGSRELFQDFRAAGVGEQRILEENVFVEAVLPGGVVRTLTSEETAAYRAPFPDAASRRPILRFVREIPVAGEPEDVHDLFVQNRQFLIESSVPKLLLYAQPGAVIDAEEVAWQRANLKTLTAAHVGAGIHFLPEDAPDEISQALMVWLKANWPAP